MERKVSPQTTSMLGIVIKSRHARSRMIICSMASLASNSRTRTANRFRETIPTLRPRGRRGPQITRSTATMERITCLQAVAGVRALWLPIPRIEPACFSPTAIPRASFRSAFIGIGEGAALTWWASKLTAGSPSSIRFAISYSEGGPASRPQLNSTSPWFEVPQNRWRICQRRSFLNKPSGLVHRAYRNGVQRNIKADVDHDFPPLGGIGP
ncbi:hypothetical protein FBZ93_12714 [Bradyrhizobium macuxiense]|uniref:Uncharacterized protein n=1 Tax=Bradyrhizobium macuxiense TaxID=1755647 RepID=A0A560L0U1_9BRAD|nr:hypothetical protein FBZ93_12714 [Bradyrhizobium macuxiense]